MQHDHLLRRIEFRAGTLGGKPVIRDTRIPVELILNLLAAGQTTESLLSGYPKIRLDDIGACFALAYAMIADLTLNQAKRLKAIETVTVN